MSDAVLHVTDASFSQDVEQSSTPVLVDFWAEWCGPCKMIAPIFEALATEYEGRVRFVKLDLDANPNTPSRFGVRSIPTLMLFKDGQVVATKVGAVSQRQLAEFVDANL